MSYFARMLPFDDFEQVCKRFRVLTDPDGSHRDHVDAREARNVTSGFVGAEFLLRARGGVPAGAAGAAGAAMIAVLDAFVQSSSRRMWPSCVSAVVRTRRWCCCGVLMMLLVVLGLAVEA